MTSSLRSFRCPVPVAFTWSHAGSQFRVTPWPEVQFELRLADEWLPVAPAPEALRAASAGMHRAAWRAYVAFVPVHVREFLACFRDNRLAALQVAARCPDVVAALDETPALTAFVVAHAALRGVESARWGEVNAVFERGGVFGLLEWLGLPASRQTLAILRNLAAPDLSPDLLDPFRRILWSPQGIFALAKLPAITDRDLHDACALAAA